VWPTQLITELLLETYDALFVIDNTKLCKSK